jgi:beta-lactamase superfamily II metal-dependent hydrolase
LGETGLSKITSKKGRGCLWAVVIFVVLCMVAACSAGTDSNQNSAQDSQSAAVQSQVSQSESSSSATASSSAKAKSSSTKKTAAKAKSSGTMVVRFVDVGQGDGSVIEFPDGKTLVIDTAADADGAVNSVLASDKRTTINWLVATHPDADHIGGLAGVIASNNVKSVWAPRVNSSTRTYTNFLNAVSSAGLSIHNAVSGKTIAKGSGYSIELLWPPKGASYSDTNDYSAIVLVKYGSKRFLFTGDAPVEAQEQAGSGHVDVLKVSHHGSASGTDDALAATLSPQIAVLSYGLDNSYGHPTQTAIDALKSTGAKVYGTGAQGTVTVTTNGKKLHVKTERSGKVVAASKDAGAGSRYLDSGDTSQKASSTSKAKASSNAKTSGGASKETVYVTPSGTKYHQKGCRTLSRSKTLIKMTRSEAEAQGYTACAVCGG